MRVSIALDWSCWETAQNAQKQCFMPFTSFNETLKTLSKQHQLMILLANIQKVSLYLFRFWTQRCGLKPQDLDSSQTQVVNLVTLHLT